MCVLQLEDMDGTIGVTIFPRLYEEVAIHLIEDTVVIISGDVQVHRDEPGIICNSLSPVKAVEEEMNRKSYQLWLKIQTSGSDEISVSNDIMKIQKLYSSLHNNPGRDHYEILISNGEWQARLTPNDNTLNYCPELLATLEQMLGPGMVQIYEMGR